MTKKIIFSTGGTGGHIFPAINLMKHFFDKGYKVLLVTDKRGNNFIKNNSEFESYILSVWTPTNKSFFKKIHLKPPAIISFDVHKKNVLVVLLFLGKIYNQTGSDFFKFNVEV